MLSHIFGMDPLMLSQPELMMIMNSECWKPQECKGGCKSCAEKNKRFAKVSRFLAEKPTMVATPRLYGAFFRPEADAVSLMQVLYGYQTILEYASMIIENDEDRIRSGMLTTAVEAHMHTENTWFRDSKGSALKLCGAYELSVMHRMALFEAMKLGSVERSNEVFNQLYPVFMTTNLIDLGEDTMMAIYNLYH
jgi:hypothetical protein